MIQLNDLNDDCLLEVLDRLPPKELFKIQRVNRRVKQLAAEKIRIKIKTITLNNDSNSVFSECAHLNGINRNQVLFLDEVFKKTSESESESFREPSKRALFLSLLAKCCGVKSIDFGECELSEGLLLEVVRRCPALECIKLCPTAVKIDDWERVLDQIGNKIVHFAKHEFNSEPTNEMLQEEERLLELVASKCNRIKQIWISKHLLTNDFMATIKMLPKRCWVKLFCWVISENTFEDVVDELEIDLMDWSAFGKRFDRLSSLKLEDVIGPIYCVDFAGLKRLEFSESFDDVAYLAASRFPSLEEFCFSTNRSLTEDNFDALFQRMPSLKKMNILFDKPFYVSFVQLPGFAIFQLKNLETIELKICQKWKLKVVLQQLEQYVDGISSLKKLSIQTRFYCLPKVFKEEIERMNLKQNHVEIDLI